MLKRLAILVGTLVTPFMVHAALMDTTPWSGTTGGGGMDYTSSLSFMGADAPKFFGGSGDLTKAAFHFDVSVGGFMTGSGLTDTTVTGTVRTVFALSAAMTSLPVFNLDMMFSMEFDEFGEGVADFSGFGSFDRTLMIPGDVAALASLTGGLGDTFVLLCKTTTTVFSVSEPGGSYDPLADTDGSCRGTLVYTFDDGDEPPNPNGVPEPGTLALVGLAMAGAAMAARRRRTV